jgi:WD40 repeat protein
MNSVEQTPTVRIRWTADLADGVQDLAWSPDGRWLAAAVVSGPLVVIDGATGEIHREWSGHDGGTLKLAWSREGRWLASGGQDGHARVWDPASGEERVKLAGGNDWVGGVSFSPYADLLITAAGKELRAWSHDGRLLHATKPHASTITDLAWHPHQPLLASSAYGQVHLWDWQSPDAPAERTLPHPSSLLGVRWSPNGRYLVCGCQDNKLRGWTWPEAQDFQMSGYLTKVRVLTWDPTSHWLAAADREIVTLWDFAQGPPMGKAPLDLEGALDVVRDLAFHPDRPWLAAGDQSGGLVVWTLRGREPQVVWHGALRGGFQRLAWHPQDRWLAVGGEDGAIAAFEFKR